MLRLFKNKKRSMLCGVCAGLSDITGIDVTIIRIIWCLSLFFSFSISFWLYIILCFVLPPKPVISIPKTLPKDIQKQLNILMEKIEKRERELKPDITEKFREAFTKLIILIQLGQDLPNLTEHLSNLVLKLEDILEKHPTNVDLIDINLFIKRLQENIELINDIKKQKIYEIKEEKNNVKEWIDFIFPLKMEFLLKADNIIKDIYFSIEEKIIFLLPYLSDENLSFDIKYNIKRTGYNYLPEIINNYLKLSKDFNINEQNIRNANSILLEQLKIINSGLDDIYNNVYQVNSEKMELHGKFLKEKFGK